MKKTFLFFLVLVFIFNISGVFAQDCKYAGKIERCNNELKSYLRGDGKYITPGASLRHIDDFVCLQDVPEKRVFQIAMEENFIEIDKEMDEFLNTLSESKDLYFGKDAEYTYFEGLNHIWEKGNYFKNKYYNSCVSSLSDASTCIKNMAFTLEEERPTVGVNEAIGYLKGSSGDCYGLTDVKIDIFNQVAYNTMILNKQQIASDEKKLYDQELRTKYDKIIDLFMINMNYIERIWKKWPSKIKNTL